MTVRGYTMAGGVLEIMTLNGLGRAVLSWTKLFRMLEVRVRFGVHARIVTIKKGKVRRTCLNIFPSMDGRRAISGGSSMVKLSV